MRNNLSVLFVSQSFYPKIGGVSSLLLGFAKNLLKKGNHVYALHFAVDDKQQKTSHGLKITEYVVPTRKINRQILNEYATFKEIIYRHLHGLQSFPYQKIESAPGFLAYEYCNDMFAKQINNILKMQNIDLIHWHDYQVLSSMKKIHSQTKKIFSFHAPLLPSVSPIVANWLISIMNEADANIFSVPVYAQTAKRFGLSTKKIKVIPPIIDTANFSSNNQFCALADKLPINAKVISSIQRFDAKSGHKQLVTAFASLCQKYQNVFLVLVGGQSFTDTISSVRQNYYNETKKLVKKLKISNRVYFTGNVDYHFLDQIYNISDIVVLLSKMECFGLTISEAMYKSKSVIVTNVGGLAFQVKNNQNGFVVEVDDIKQTSLKLEKLIVSQTLRQKMGSAGKTFFESKLSPTKIMNEQYQLYVNTKYG